MLQFMMSMPLVTIDMIRTRRGVFLLERGDGLLLGGGRDVLFYVGEREGVFYADAFWCFLEGAALYQWVVLEVEDPVVGYGLLKEAFLFF